ncbi:DUF6483 family protein [Paenibacillus sp. HJGM_3]|uniref:DUF6483 family protein n=1 Tax=Paenibacillus sp. HJGM_3 TaxID=3379816 RepID=UPI0038597686
MFQRDYMLRLIEQITQAVGVLIGLKQNRDPLQALQHIDELLRRMLGLNPKLLRSLSDQALLELLRQGPDGGPDKLLIVAMLLKEEGDCQQMLGDFTTAYQRHCRALGLYLAAAAESAERTYVDYPAEIRGLLETLRRYELPVPIRLELWRFHMAEGHYADAENELFSLFEDGHGSAPLLADAIARYEQLLTLDKARLEAGGLSLLEVEDALEQLRGKLESLTE